MINNTYKPLASLSSSPLNLKSLGSLPPTTQTKSPGILSPLISGITPLSSNTKPANSVSGPNLSGAVANLNKQIAPVAKPFVPTPESGTQQGSGVDQTALADVRTQAANLQSQLDALKSQQDDGTKTPVKGLFPDISQSLYGGLVGKGQEQLGEAAKTGQEAANLRKQIALETQAVNGNNNYSGPVRVGQAGLIQQNLGTQLDALTGQQNSLNDLGQSYLTAADKVKVEPTAFGQTTFNPVTGQFGASTGTNLDPQTTAAQLAQKVNSGQMTYDQAVSSLGFAGSAGQQFLNQSLQQINPNFSIPQSNATIAGQQDIAKNVVGMQAANNAAKGIENTIVSFLAQNPDLNPSNVAAGNTIQQWIQGKQLTDPKYQTLFNYINEYISTLAPVLGVGGDTTNLKTEIAQSFINAKASGQSISEVLKSISSLADKKITDFQSGGAGNPGAGSTNSSSGGLFSW